MGKRAIEEGAIRFIKELRYAGNSITEIRKKTGYGFGTIYKHVKDLDLNDSAIFLLKEKRNGSKVKKINQEKLAQEVVFNIFKSKKIDQNRAYLITSLLYFAEGAKKDFSIINSNPVLLRIFLENLINIGVDRRDVRIHVRLYEDLDKDKAVKFWLDYLDLPRISFQSFEILKGKKTGKLEFGMCRIRLLKGGFYLKIFKNVVDYIGKFHLPT